MVIYPIPPPHFSLIIQALVQNREDKIYASPEATSHCLETL